MDWHPIIPQSTQTRYFPIIDMTGGEGNIETSDGNPVWKTIYFEGLQYITNFAVYILYNSLQFLG